MSKHASDSPAEPKKLMFYCRDCDECFESEPDGTGYEQTFCPKCRAACMTVQFEQEEKQRNRDEALFFSILDGVANVLHFGVTAGIRLAKRVSRGPEASGVTADQPEAPPIDAPAVVGTFGSLMEANEYVRILAEEGIASRLVGLPATDCVTGGASGGIPLRVDAPNADRAKKIIEREQSERASNADRTRQKGVIRFACEECGAVVSFPGSRRGRVEVCPRCGRYIDVPE